LISPLKIDSKFYVTGKPIFLDKAIQGVDTIFITIKL